MAGPNAKVLLYCDRFIPYLVHIFPPTERVREREKSKSAAEKNSLTHSFTHTHNEELMQKFFFSCTRVWH